MGLLTGKTALVTGGSRGIGEAIVRRFAAEGADVAFTCRHLPEGLVADYEQYGTRILAFESDAADFAAAHEVVARVHEAFGRIDILVNNAGITRDALILRMDESAWDEILSANLKSAFNYVHAVAPILARQRCGSVINISSTSGTHGNVGQINYSAAKSGMVGLAKSVAKELGSRGVRANCIAPGLILSDMTEKLSDSVKTFWLNNIPMHRWGTKDEVASVALFLASDLSTYVSGQVISCCGALTA
ncbi:MAG: SDR family oxidoreductase [Bacteroidales bacterium]|nr:SDR family oxidoreductase [Bacteroidales bacterium]